MMRLLSCVFIGWVVALAAFPVSVQSATAAETEIRYLSGTGPDDAVEWDFYATAGRKARVWSKIKVPSCWETQGFGTYNYGGSLLWNDEPFGNEQGLYRHEFTVPATWQGQVVRIVFEGAMTDTTVWINGQPAGPTHIGGFYRFHYDVSALLKYGETKTNLLEVTVAKVSANRSVNEAERAADYWVFGGIFRPVRLEALPQNFIDWTAIDADADGTFLAQVNLGTPVESAAEVRAQVLDANGSPVGSPLTATVTAGEARAEIRGKFDGVKRWTAETPHLYRVRFTLDAPQPAPPLAGGNVSEVRARPGEMRPSHTVAERFGFRTIEVRPNDGVYLNGTKIVLKGINRHCFWPETGRTVSRNQSYADARLIKEANLNAVRMSHYPPDTHFLEACDELGLYVLDELAGWQKAYTKAVGRRLIGQMIRRDVNHPSILFWDNGNEGGWNTENDDQFAVWDPQKRPVLHPWGVHSHINTDHYEKYDSTVKLSAGPQIFMPTEFLHGLYDGGIGAGFRDFWDVMRKSPTVAGGFFWVFADEGVVRADQDGRIDNAGNQAPDGIVGPHRQKEGSFFAIKEIWSPVQLTPTRGEGGRVSADWDGTLVVKNEYDFTNVDKCTLSWELLRWTTRGHEVVTRGDLRGPHIAPRASGEIRIPLPTDGKSGDALLVTVHGPDGRALWTSSWDLSGRAVPPRSSAGAGAPTAGARRDGTALIAELNGVELRFNASTGSLESVRRGDHALQLSGPDFAAYRRNERRYAAVNPSGPLMDLASREEQGAVIVESRYDGPLRLVRWSLSPQDGIRFSYEYAFDGDVDVLGVYFSYPSANITSKRWLGRGPYRVYRNRLEGGVFYVHEVGYNDPIPGQTYAYPEFRGYFRDWRWLTLATSEGGITVENESGVPFLGLYAPRDGEPSMLAFPNTGLAFLEVIPAIGTKFDPPEDLGPQSQPVRVSGLKTGSIVFRFDPRGQ